jgi:serine/threonine protein phosphatase PrpC
MSYHWAVATDQGRVRTINEDSVHPQSSGKSEGPVVVLVADGMGGHVAGERASQIAAERAVQAKGSLAERVREANLAIFDEAAEHPELSGMGTTLTMFELGEDQIVRFAHVGDSRGYLFREGTLTQLTSDHTVVAEYLRQGAITPEEVSTHPQRSLITRALGLDPDLDVDTGEVGVEPGDRLLLCSDGVNAMIDDDAIAAALSQPTPEEAAWDLVERANRAGGHDNITALVVEVD